MRGFDKFAWIEAIRHDEQLPDGLKYVLTHIAIVYLMNDGDGHLYARQSTVANELRTNTRQIQRAYAEARRLGYFALVAERKRGRSHYSPDTYALVIPEERPDNLSPINERIPDRIDINTRQNRQEYPTESTEIPAMSNTLTSANLTIKGIKQGIKQGEEGETAARATAPHPPEMQEQPSNNSARGASSRTEKIASHALRGDERPHCRRHPDGNSNDEACRQCGKIREWDIAQAEADQKRALDDGRLAAIPTCGQCDDDGYVHGRALDCEGKTPFVCLWPAHADRPEYIRNWLDEYSSGELTWLQLKCPHGTGDENDPRALPVDRQRALWDAGVESCGLDAFLAAAGDPAQGRQLETDAGDEWRRLRDERFRAEMKRLGVTP